MRWGSSASSRSRRASDDTSAGGTVVRRGGVLVSAVGLCGVSLRRRLGHPARTASLDNHILVVRGRRRLLGFVVDRVEGDELVDDAIVEPPAEGTRHLAGVVALADGVLLIQDVDAMLTDVEEEALDASLGEEAPRHDGTARGLGRAPAQVVRSLAARHPARLRDGLSRRARS